MTELNLTLACWAYDRVQPLADRTVRPDGVTLTVHTMRPKASFDRMVHDHEFDISEMFLAPYMTMWMKGDCPFVAIPVFISRAFRHDVIFINSKSGIETPSDLRGKRVGLSRYDSTTAVFVKGMLQDDYGVRPGDVTWVWGDQDNANDGPAELTQPRLPSDVRLERAPVGATLSGLLEDRQIDALIAIRLPAPFVRGSSSVRRLFPDYKRAEIDYFRRTGIFPIMHTIVLRADLHARHPWVAASLYRAFCEAKVRALGPSYDTDALLVSLPFLVDNIEELRRVFGNDYWPYGVDSSRRTLTALARYLADQHLVSGVPDVDRLFAAVPER